MRSHNRIVLLALAASLCSIPLQAQEVPSLPADAAYGVRINVNSLRRLSLGESLLARVEAIAAAEYSKTNPEEKSLKEIHRVLGFDPLGQLRSIDIFGADCETPAKQMLIVLGFGRTTGNVEGLLLSLRGYDSTKYGKSTIHSATPKGDTRVYCTIHQDGVQDRSLVVGHQLADAEAALDALNTGELAGDEVRSGPGDPVLIEAKVNRIPQLHTAKALPKAVARLLESVVVIISGDDRKLAVSLTLTAAESAGAEQLQQLIQGMIAVSELARDAQDLGPDLAELATVVDELQMVREGKRLQLTLEVPAELVERHLTEAFRNAH